jgi:branched-subunit amino acid permease
MWLKIARLLLGGCIAGLIVGLLYCLFLVWLGVEPLSTSLSAAHIDNMTVLCAALAVLLAWASTWLGRRLSGLNGGVLWLAALTAAVATVELVWLFDLVDFGNLSLDEKVCFAVSFTAFVLATGFFARTPDKLVQ